MVSVKLTLNMRNLLSNLPIKKQIIQKNWESTLKNVVSYFESRSI